MLHSLSIPLINILAASLQLGSGWFSLYQATSYKTILNFSFKTAKYMNSVWTRRDIVSYNEQQTHSALLSSLLRYGTNSRSFMTHHFSSRLGLKQLLNVANDRFLWTLKKSHSKMSHLPCLQSRSPHPRNRPAEVQLLRQHGTQQCLPATRSNHAYMPHYLHSEYYTTKNIYKITVATEVVPYFKSLWHIFIHNHLQSGFVKVKVEKVAHQEVVRQFS